MSADTEHDVLGYGERAVSDPAAAALDDRATEYGVRVAQAPPAKQRKPPPATTPVECKSERIQWDKSVQSDVATILTASPSMGSVYERVRARVKILKDEPRGTESGELGQTGRLSEDKDNRNLVVIQIAWSKTGSRFRLASILSHEYAHAEQALNRGFTTAEAAPFMSAKQFALLRWWSEYDAFDFQARVLREIVQAKPVYEICEKRLLDSDSRLKALYANDSKAARQAIRFDYPSSRIEREHARHSDVSTDERAKLADVGSAVTALLASPDWKGQESAWR